MRKLINDESGAALATTLMILVILVVLGTTTASIALANVKLTAEERDYQSAHYIAEAGANEAYLEIEKLVHHSYQTTSTEEAFLNQVNATLAARFDKTYDDFEAVNNEAPVAEVSVKNDSGNEIEIIALGRIGSRQRSINKRVTLNWIAKGSNGQYPTPTLPKGYAAVVRSLLKVYGGGRIHGNALVESRTTTVVNVTKNSFKPKSNGVDYIEDNPNLTVDWSLLDEFFNNFPSAPTLMTHPNVTEDVLGQEISVINNGRLRTGYNGRLASHTLEIKDNYYFESIDLAGTLNIDVGNNDQTIVVKNLNTAGMAQMNIIGDGSLTVHVLNQLNLQYGSVNSGGRTNQLTFFYHNHTPLHLKTDAVNAGIIVKDAVVKMSSNSNHNDHNGLGYLLTGGDFVYSDNGFKGEYIIVGPYAEANFQGGVRFSGVALVDRFVAGNGMRLEYKEVDTSGFVLDFITIDEGEKPPTNNQGIEDLITAGPGIGS